MKFHPPTTMFRAAAVLASVIVACLTLPAAAQDDPGPVKVTTAWSATGVQPGGRISLAVVLDIDKRYHVNPAVTKEGFIPTRVELIDPPADLQFSTPIYPAPHPFVFGEDKQPIEVYSKRAVIVVPMAVKASAPPGERKLTLRVRYQACDDKVCLLPKKVDVEVALNVSAPTAQVQPTNTELFAGAVAGGERLNIPFFGYDFEIDPTGLVTLLLVAAIGGFLLNLTPCVLPLIPIKVMSLGQAASGSRRRSLVLGVAMSAGIVAFWMALAILISTVSGFQATNQLFQYPAFTIGVGVVIAVMAVGMTGLFAVRLPQWVYMVNPKQESVGGSFLFGIMTAVLSTPCTAPFMGAAAAWAATRHPAITLATFAAIGAGMALPYLLLAIFPALVHRMPRAGPASELIKQIMGLLMLAAAAFFVGTGLVGLLASPPDPPSRVYWWFVAAFIAAAGLWVIRGTMRITKSPAKRVIFAAMGVLFLATAGHVGVRFSDRGPVHWVYYTPQRLEEAKKQSKVVVLEFTAEWCLNCKALEEAVLSRPEVYTRLNSDKVAAIKVDITNYEEANRKLAEVGAKTIPLLIVYDKEGKEVFRSDAYTPSQVSEAVDKAAGHPVSTGAR